MDVEFHYYMTYLIAVKSGFENKQAQTIAYSSQYIDDNDIIFNISQGTEDYYKNYISQTKNITKPRKKLFRIYPLFHFIPGDPLTEKARRRDGKLHYLNTTPDNDNANQLLDAALTTNNLYKIGMAVHAFADTYAHQNFAGYYDAFNSLRGILKKSPSKIGHASAGHKPDIPNLIWNDQRLLTQNSERNNKEIFLKAAARIFEKLKRHNNPEVNTEELKKEKEDLLVDLSAAVGETTSEYSFFKNLFLKGEQKKRINNYLKLSSKKCYGSSRLEKYNAFKWLNQVLINKIKLSWIKFKRKIPYLSVLLEFLAEKFDKITGLHLTYRYHWQDSSFYKKSHWYQFQEAVKELQDTAEAIIGESVFSKMELEEL
jgi:hypothetical protein